MYLKIDDDLMKKVQAITCTDYECEGNYIPYDSIISLIEDLLSEIDTKDRELNNLKQDIEDNYRPIPVKEQIGYNERNFI